MWLQNDDPNVEQRLSMSNGEKCNLFWWNEKDKLPWILFLLVEPKHSDIHGTNDHVCVHNLPFHLYFYWLVYL
jgi:hypothetical protein